MGNQRNKNKDTCAIFVTPPHQIHGFLFLEIETRKYRQKFLESEWSHEVPISISHNLHHLRPHSPGENRCIIPHRR